MAALSDRLLESVVPLRNVRPEQLGPLLDEEIAEWGELNWDFRPSADLVRRFAGMQALDGFVLFAGPQLVGFSYSVAEEGKGLIGDLYVSPAYRTLEREYILLDAILNAMWRIPGLRRIEAQLLMLSQPLERVVPHQRWFQPYARQFFEARTSGIGALREHEPAGVSIAPWTEMRQDDAARVIAASYRSHIDSRINDQYRSVAGARRFLTNIVQYPGCGTFFPPASFVAIHRATQSMCGLCLASMVAPSAGHITQICIKPELRGVGLGYELLRRSLVALDSQGAKTISLTVTSSNSEAIRLYEQMGFARSREFAAYVWEKD